jgi:hypothetical protein
MDRGDRFKAVSVVIGLASEQKNTSLPYLRKVRRAGLSRLERESEHYTQ